MPTAATSAAPITKVWLWKYSCSYLDHSGSAPLLSRQVPVAPIERHSPASAQAAYDDLVNALSPGRAAAADVRDIGRMIEELRVSLWAQQLGTARPVSEQRIYRAIDAV